MTRNQACRILGVSLNASKQDIKKKYRLLMHQVHPDSGAFSMQSEYSAQEINEAYAVLYKNTVTNKDDGISQHYSTNKKTAKEKKTNQTWDAPVNKHAYMERDVYHFVEDYDGNVIGDFIVATGKYIWKTEEDFSLFLKSIYNCSKKLLDNIDNKRYRENDVADEKRLSIQPELTYLLAQQYIDIINTLSLLAKDEKENNSSIYHIDCMLELGNEATYAKAGMILYPAGIKKHRLYLKTRSGKCVGYLSFRDDRLYYIVIPLFEQKRAKIKIVISDKQDRHTSKNINRYKNLDVWLKISDENNMTFPENLNMQIEELLREYQK